MEQGHDCGRLSQITTPWTDLALAHGDTDPALTPARRRVLLRYSAAVSSYLHGAVRDPDVAEDLFQEFALRLMRGAFRRADPRSGRFRDFLKTALCHLVTDYYRAQRRAPCLCPDVSHPAGERSALAEAEERFCAEWRSQLIDRTFAALEVFEGRTGQPLYTLLRFREEHPGMSASDMAAHLGERLDRELIATWVYKHLHQARQKFADLLVEEVARTLDYPSALELEQEMAELGLLRWCRPALRRWGGVAWNRER